MTHFDKFDIETQGDTVTLEAQWRVPFSADQVFTVLIDFPAMVEWMPDLQESRVLDQHVSTLRVQQIGRLLGIPLGTELEVGITPGQSVRFRQIQGSFDRFEGIWEVVPEDGQTRIRYRLQVAHPLIRLARWLRPYVEAKIIDQIEGLNQYLHRVYASTRVADASS